MPFLEQRRRTYQTDSLIGALLSRLDNLFDNLLQFSTFSMGRYWALVWAIIHLTGFVLGSIFPELMINGSMDCFSRVSAILPAFLGIISRKWAPSLWILVFFLSFAAGSLESGQRSSRISVKAPSPWEPSKMVSFKGTAVFRTTAWAKAGSDSFWQVPAILLGWKPVKEQPLLCQGPKIGETMLVSGKGLIPLPGEVFGSSLKIRVPAAMSLPGTFDDRRYLQGRAIHWRAKSAKVQKLNQAPDALGNFFHILGNYRQRILTEIQVGIPAPESYLMMAVLLGARSPEAREAAQPFSRLGLSHLFAVSGLHVGIIVGIMLLPLGFFHLQPGWRLLPACLFLPFYILLTGAPGSVVRAASMTILLLLAVPLGRKSYSLQLLGLIFWAGIIWQPIQVLDPGLRLSYLATGGIIVITSFIGASETNFWRSKWGKLGLGLVVSLAAQWFTFPQVASSFGYISGFSPFANLLAVPLFGLAVWALVLGLLAGSFLPYLGQSLLSWTWIIVRFLTGILGHVSPWVQSWNLTFPMPGIYDGAIWFVATLLLLVTLKMWSTGKLKGIKAFLVLSLLLFGIPTIFQRGGLGNGNLNGVHVWQFDVGQGDSSLIMFPDKWCGIIDTAGVRGWGSGTKNSVFQRQVQPWMLRQHISEIGAIVLTHGHLDHTGGTPLLVAGYTVQNIYTGGRSWQSLSESKQETIRPSPGTILHRWQDWQLFFVQPDTVLTSHLHENDKSLVVVLKKGKSVKMVWTGDMEENEEHIMLLTPWMPKNTMVLKAGHHGSNTSSSQPFLDALSPALVLISCGTGNQYNHPSHGSYTVLGDTLPIIRTDISGSIHLWWDPPGNLFYEAGKKKGFMPKP